MSNNNEILAENGGENINETKLNKIDSDDDDLDENTLENQNFVVKLSSNYLKVIRNVKVQIEEVITKKLKNIDSIQNAESNEKCIYYYKNYSIDNVGHPIGLGETGIAEGWSIPKYSNEFQNLLGLPFTEDHSIRIKKPRLECFNCLSTNHPVRECPVKIDEERISMHRNSFNTQSLQAHEQAQLFSNRYTSDADSKACRGFFPGKISDELRRALGIKPNQIPPFVYVMRLYGYPIGWFLEAKVRQTSKLAVHDGIDKSIDAGKEKMEEGIVGSDEEENKKDESFVYDEDKIFTFEGFNQAPSSNYIDESEKYGVRRYSLAFSREQFLSTLKLQDKKKIVKRRNINKTEVQSDEDGGVEDESNKSIESVESNQNNSKSEEANSNASSDHEINTTTDDPFTTPKPSKRMKVVNELGTSFHEIQGTPIVNTPINAEMALSNIDKVPDWAKFAENICEHKEFEMGGEVPTGSYKNIVKLTRKFKSDQ